VPPTPDEVRRKARLAFILRAVSTADVDLGDGRRGNGERLKRYWLTEGLHRWATKRHPWRTLRRLLLQKTKNPNLATRLATELVHAHFGLYPGHDAYRLMHGGKIRGKRIGPG
jgi:hypothetical protein